ncbi:AI-2E family transporter [Natronorubrum thiooxidans]|uniref:Predicted PurR-regulated permease PerM n=1 Tax=Natronorubrum thiooxidans TaxID=308853 RepID=A0A1N7FAT9_9EURY|nr:AI-2E family transporter [Natronorubrum thiooxidans]SIR97429.1 Predicted PurR-regulated permease PerM [Natronorubrum thiooxidans]
MNVSKGFYLLLATISAVLTLALVWPFLQYVLLAVLLAYVLYPLQKRLEPRIGSSLSSLSLVIGATLAIIVPFAVMIGLIATDVLRFARSLEDGGPGVGRLEATISERTGQDVNIADTATSGAQRVSEGLLGGAPDALSGLIHALIGIGLAAFLLYFLLKDGTRLFAWTREIVPLPRDVQETLFEELDRLTWAVLVGHVVVAVIQGVLAGLGLLATGVPNVVFWTFVMILLSLIPLIGSFAVWAPAAVWLAITGSTVAAVALVIYGAIVVGTSDEFLRPLIVGRADVNPSIIIVGVIGGMYLMGFMGLFFGPVIVGACKVILETFDDHYDDLEPAGDW